MSNPVEGTGAVGPVGSGVVGPKGVVGLSVTGGQTTVGSESLKFNDVNNSLYLALISVGGM
jgi:hypothetical protein